MEEGSGPTGLRRDPTAQTVREIGAFPCPTRRSDSQLLRIIIPEIVRKRPTTPGRSRSRPLHPWPRLSRMSAVSYSSPLSRGTSVPGGPRSGVLAGRVPAARRLALPEQPRDPSNHATIAGASTVALVLVRRTRAARGRPTGRRPVRRPRVRPRSVIGHVARATRCPHGVSSGRTGRSAGVLFALGCGAPAGRSFRGRIGGS